MTNIALENIETLRLPELRALFTEVTGETTKSPNKTFLIRRIREAIAEQAAEVIEEEQAIERLEQAADESTQESAAPAQDADTDDDEPTLEPDASDDEQPAASDEMVADASDDEPPATSDETPTEDAPDAGGSEKRLSKMSVEELQARYIEVIGRPTGSSDRRYLIWKIREAGKGRIPVGPRTRRNPSEPARNYMILPVRIESGLVERMDDARERIGLKNRMDLFRRALAHYFANAGEHALAADILPHE